MYQYQNILANKYIIKFNYILGIIKYIYLHLDNNKSEFIGCLNALTLALQLL